MSKEVEKIIVRMPNWIGDLVMATPVLADLRKAFPKAEITAMCRVPLCDLLSLDPHVDEIFCFTKFPNSFSHRQEKRNLIEKLRTGKYDLGILLTNSFSSAWWFWQGKVARRIGYGGGIRRWLLTTAVSPSVKAIHQVEAYKRLLEPLGVHHTKTSPHLTLSEEELGEARMLLDSWGFKGGASLIGINPGAAYGSAKCWPPEKFRALALYLLEHSFATILFFGDETTRPLVKQICQGFPERVIDLSGMTSLRELTCLIQCCDVVVTNDSGPLHIAAALNVPLVALFGSTNPEKTGPYRDPEAVIYKQALCSPCMRRVCPIDFRCMRQIEVKEVAEKTLALLQSGMRSV